MSLVGVICDLIRDPLDTGELATQFTAVGKSFAKLASPSKHEVHHSCLRFLSPQRKRFASFIFEKVSTHMLVRSYYLVSTTVPHRNTGPQGQSHVCPPRGDTDHSMQSSLGQWLSSVHSLEDLGSTLPNAQMHLC